MKKVILMCIVFMLTLTANAQEYLEEVYSGYSGGINKNIELTPKSLNFIVMGDWGRMGGFHQKSVAEQMGISAITANAKFFVSVGDNFYPNGVQSTQDHQWQSSFENIYTTVNLHEDWIVALGNHDYRGSIQAQIDYSKISRRWTMPAPYFDTLIAINGKDLLHLIIMDTNPFVDKYQQSPEQYPDIRLQDTAQQMMWLKERLSLKNNNIKWKMVVGHHPLYSGGKRKTSSETLAFEKRFAKFFDDHKVDAFICGHEHDLQIIKPDNRYTTQFLSGAASEIRPSGNTVGTKYAGAEPGFMLFSVLNNKLLVQVMKADGTVLYKYALAK